ncbi:MAG: AAA family ATPase [Phycisphaerales bacterium]|nr:AAA family ATPase [Phycisphaerales bacterium]
MSDIRRGLVLMGLRGSGKSTLGRLVAGRLGWPFVDLDDVTVGLLGGPGVPEVWSRVGEAGFREAEALGLAERVLGAGRQVVALGGGTPTAPGAAEMLRAAVGDGRIELVYLRGTPATLRERLEAQGAGDRPSLTGRGTLAEIESVFAARDELYRGLASRVVEIGGESVESLTALLVSVAGG